MKLWEVEFEGVWPVGSCLIILAETIEEATAIANRTIQHPQDEPIAVTEVDMNKSKVVVYLSGDY